MKQELFECCVQNLHIFLLKRPEHPKTFRGVWVKKVSKKYLITRWPMAAGKACLPTNLD
jgi:hypothetical protein